MKIYSNAMVLDVIKTGVQTNMPVLLIGETGVGKTTMIRELAKERKKELVRVNLNGQTGVEELVGKWLIDKGKTVWHDGVMVTAMKRGDWIVFDEINAALPEVLFTLNSLLDDDRKIMMAEKNGEVVRPADEFRFFATMNPSDEYAGTKELNKALLSRFGAVLRVEPLDEDNEKDMLINSFKLDKETAGILARIATLLREAKKKEEIFFF
jgi:midasin